jgi:hypothetical protein
MSDDHVGERAELYALGQLDALDIGRVERHARACDACAKRLGEAEAAVLELIEGGDVPAARPEALDRRMRFVRPPAPTAAWIGAVAAAFVIGLLPWSVAMTHRPAPPASSQGAIDAMLAGHFTHAPLVALRADAPPAKVIYAREGGWIYVLAGPGSAALDVATVTNGSTSVVASLAPSAQARAVFARFDGRAGAVVLLDRGTPVARAQLAYPP